MGDALPGFDVISTVGVLRDLPPDVADLVATLEMVANTTKPLVLLVSEDAAFGPALDLLETLCGDLAAKPFVLPYFNPVTPLVINAGTSDKMTRRIGRGCRSSSPITAWRARPRPSRPAGTLALLNAELLAGLALASCARGRAGDPGQPARGFRHGDDDELLRARDDAAQPGVRRDDGALPPAALRHLGQRAGWGADLPAAEGFG